MRSRHHMIFKSGCVFSLTLLIAGCTAEQEPIYRAMSLASVGDWNDDGVSDFAVGEFERSRVLILSGNDGSIVRTIRGEHEFGWSLCALQQGAEFPYALAVGSPRVGEVSVYTHSDSASISTMKGDPGVFGWALSATDDLDGDGLADLAVAQPKFDRLAGSEGSPACLVSSMTGERFVEAQDSGSYELLGFSIATLPLGESQTAPDLLVGTGWVPTVLRFNGEDGRPVQDFATLSGGVPHSYPICVLGDTEQDFKVAIGNPDTKDSGTAVLFDLESEELLRWRGNYHGDRFGHAIVAVGNRLEGATANLLITAPGRIKSAGVPLKPVAIKDKNPEGAAPGYAHLYSVEDGKLIWSFSKERPGDWLGIAACSLLDVNGDGVNEVLLGGQSAETGRNFVVLVSGADGKLIYEIDLPE